MKSYYNFNPMQNSKHNNHNHVVYEESSVIFEFLKFKSGHQMKTESLSKNYILAFISGEHEIEINLAGKHILKAEEILCLPKYSKLSAKTLVSGDIIIITFEVSLSSGDVSSMHEYLSTAPITEFRFMTLTMDYAMKHFFEMVAYLIESKRTSTDLYKVKFNEFFILLKSYYSKEEITHFLGLSILGISEFSIYIYSNYHEAKNLQELIAKSHYSRAAFYRKFRENFSDITPQRWFNIQKRSQFLLVGSLPDITPKLMMKKLNLNSMSTMNRLCQELFDCTPMNLIKKLKQ